VCADIGLCLIKNSGKSYYYSTPNKMFEFIQAQVPQIASDFPEMKKFVKGFGVGETANPEDKKQISATINSMINDEVKLKEMKNKCREASEKLIWENMENDLLEFIN
ncbi:MAG: glycosyl transferase family 1, partial [Candidatus Delongbacteria bacterium]|nr:glycosyl transferase family 1 [Candidatus Delongbacteria bacterium]